MTTSYADISVQERKRLAVVAYRCPGIRNSVFAAVLLPILFSGPIADGLAPHGISFIAHFGIRLAVGLVFSAVLWESFGRRRLKCEIVRLKNS
jgi:hypothetical protein